MKKLFTFCRYLQALNLKVYLHKHLCVLFALTIFTGLPSLIIAQTTLPYGADITTPGVTDYIVPSNIFNMYVSVAGAQGGSTTGTCIYNGGKGFYWQAQFPVSYCSPTRIAPGGTLRLIVGGQGCGVRRAPDLGGAGGGGGSALLYKAPGSTTWVILVVAGGGGGAAFQWQELNDHCEGADGGDALWGNDGGRGTNDGGSGGTNGNGGTGIGVYSFGGGGAYSDGITTASQSCNGKQGFPNGGAQGNCNDLATYYGGFGFGSGGAGIGGGGGGGGYSGGGAGQSNALYVPGGGGGGGSYLAAAWVSQINDHEAIKTGDGEITITSNIGTLTPPVSLASSTLPNRQVVGCNLNNCAYFGYSTKDSTITESQLNALGGTIVTGGCSVNKITYRDSIVNVNPIKTIYRTFTVTDAGNNKAVAKQTINIVDPGIAATISPSSQVVCVNVQPATISLNVVNPGQFAVNVQWYNGPDNIFSDATPIPGAISLDYSPPATSVAGITYYFGRITDGCGGVAIQKATVSVGQPVTWYKDLDNDGYYDSSYHGQPTCSSPGVGYKSTGLLGIDCNDNDATINPQTVWVLDADGDSYYSGSPYTGCLPNGSTGYVKKTNQLPGDCNDSNAAIHPGATEVFNGKDDNCDGKIDEGLCAVAANLTAINITDNSATVKWDSALNGNKYNLSYRADNVSTWTVIKNIKATSYNFNGLPLYYTYDYKVQTLCPYAKQSVYSKVAKFNTTYGGPTYCATRGNTYYEYIKKVVLGSAINNTSGDNNGYGDYNGLNVTIAAGGTYQIKLTPGFHTGIDTEYWEVYIDYNHDGLFGKIGEKVATGHSKGTLTKNFTVPLTAKNGLTRMRVMMHFDSALNQPCGNFINGEAEDYTVIITGGAAALVTSEDTEASQATGMSSIFVIPNPVNSSAATAVLNMIKEGNAFVRITDLSGRTLYKKEVTNLHTGKNTIALNGLVTLSNGVYMVEAEQNGILIGRGKVVVEK